MALKNKGRRKGCLRILTCAVLLLVILFLIDLGRFYTDLPPWFAIRTETYKDGGTKVYYGVGYKVIRWNKLHTLSKNDTVFQGVLKGKDISFFPFYKAADEGPGERGEFIIKDTVVQGEDMKTVD